MKPAYPEAANDGRQLALLSGCSSLNSQIGWLDWIGMTGLFELELMAFLRWLEWLLWSEYAASMGTPIPWQMSRAQCLHADVLGQMGRYQYIVGTRIGHSGTITTMPNHASIPNAETSGVFEI